MNKKKKSVKKFTFEPKLPSQKIEEVKPYNKAIELEDSIITKGRFPPIQINKKMLYKYNPSDDIILNIPYDIKNIKFIVFEDDTCAIKVGDCIRYLNVISIEEDVVVEVKDNIQEVGSIKYYLTPI